MRGSLNTAVAGFFKKEQTKKVNHTLGRVLFNIGFFLLVAGLCFVLLYPILYMLTMAFRPMAEGIDPSVIWVSKSLTLDNIKLAWEVLDFGNTLKNTLTIHIPSSLLQVAVCATAGYGFARFNFKGRGLLFALVLLTVMVPPQLTIIPLARNLAYFDFFGLGRIVGLFGVNGTVNLLNTPAPFYVLAAFGTGIKAGLFIFIFRQFFRGLPRELEEAALIDGCGFFAAFVRVILPNAGAVSVSAVILSVVWYWNDYYYTSVLSPGMRTVSMALSGMGTLYEQVFNQRAQEHETAILLQAGALLVILPILIMYIVLQRKLVQGMERSGLVG